jgi:glycosyltransferase involved in cell wall biosynthesis
MMLSICCIAYNHEKYIHEAIEGFLIQQTDFEFDIIIHDDASLDNTAKVILEYADS